MFEKFTEKAINAITEAQNQAKQMHNVYVQPEHLLLGIIICSKGIPLKLFRMYNITVDEIKKEVEQKLRFEKTDKVYKTVPFSPDFKELLKNILDLANSSENKYVLFEHLMLAVIEDKHSYSVRILEKMGFQVEKAKEILYKLVQKRKKKLEHPEDDTQKEVKDAEYNSFDTDYLFEGDTASEIVNKTREKCKNSGYEMIGTEHILSSIIATQSTNVYDILQEMNITEEKFEEILSTINGREEEYLNRKILLTPSAFKLMQSASETAKELGSPTIKSEHIILSLLKQKQGIAYNVLNKMGVNYEKLQENIMAPIEKQMPQSLTILKLAKQEARRLGRNVVGTEMILLGIISEGTGIGFSVLNNLEITLKDVREIIEKTIGYGNEYTESEINFTRRAKRILEVAWQKAKKYKRSRIMSEHLLYAITTEPSSVAMMALEQLGVDALEIRQGIMKEIEN